MSNLSRQTVAGFAIISVQVSFDILMVKICPYDYCKCNKKYFNDLYRTVPSLHAYMWRANIPETASRQHVGCNCRRNYIILQYTFGVRSTNRP